MDIQDIQAIKQRYGIIGNASKLNIAIRNAALAAPTDISILITGESGSGKESFSKIIHQMSHRKHGKFIAVNCGAIPSGTINSELFGHEKGSFTGASDSRKGYFEDIDGGTIFLDEIGEMPLDTQALLLRVLENSEFIRVGSNKVQKTDVRIVAATNVNLQEKINQGKFREDLFFRLSGVHILVPPLRDRESDVLLLFRKFASDFAEKYRVKPIFLDDDAKLKVLDYPFPGNIRQLRNLVNQMSILEMDNRIITAEKLLNYLPKQTSSSSLPALIPNMSSEGSQSYSDRDLLYKILFDMRNEVTELKKLVLSIMQSGGTVDSQTLKGHEHLFHNIEADEPIEFDETPRSYEANNFLLPPTVTVNRGIDNPPHTFEAEEEIEDITHKIEEENLSLQDKEKELIIKALKKHNNKRKSAAEDLGISQRTLYRKIKQYGITE